MKEIIKRIVTILLSVCALCDCTTDLEVTTGGIYGVVSYSNSAEPVKGVGVELYILYNRNDLTYKGDLLFRTTTSDDGSFSFENLNVGSYLLQVVSVGYETASYRVTVEAGRTARADMQLVEETLDINVGTMSVSNVTNLGATFNGKFEVTLREDRPTECGFFYSTSKNPKDGGVKVVAEKVVDSDYSSLKGTFYASVSGLASGTYYVQAYATRYKAGKDDCQAYGDIVSFEISGEPQVETLDVVVNDDKSVNLKGAVVYEGSPAYTEKGFVYSKSYTVPTIDDPSDATTKMPVSGSANEFSVVVDSLEINKTYYVRTYITNQNGTTYGQVKTFKINPDYFVLSAEGLMVQAKDINPGKRMRWDVAYAMCENSTVGGFDDWRMPTIQELLVLYLHKEEIGNFKCLNSAYSYYWSSDKVYSDDNYFTCLSFYDSSLKGYYYNTAQWYVRAVRTIK